MSANIIVVNNFYGNPEQVRAHALSRNFTVSGNYPGARTGPLEEPYFTNMKHEFEKLVGKPIPYWPKDYNTAFQYTTKEAESWVHHDLTEWAAVVYLTPNAPVDSGTALYRHIETGITRFDANRPETEFNDRPDQINDLSNWEQVMMVGNVFNRLVMYHGDYYHRSIRAGFGDDRYNGRLFETFFFNT